MSSAAVVRLELSRQKMRAALQSPGLPAGEPAAAARRQPGQ